VNEEILVEVESLAPGGDAAGRQPDGRVVFVPLAAPGERARVQIVREKERVAWGELVAIERPGPDRVAPKCALFGVCGGCQWQHVTVAAQHLAKRTIVQRALGAPGAPAVVEPVIAASPAFGYRDRAKVAVGPGATPRPVGFRARRSHEIVDVPSCPLFSRALDAAWPAVRALASRLPAGAEIDLQAGAEGVHVNVGQVDDTGAAVARRDSDRLRSAGVVGFSVGGKLAWGLTEVDVAEAGGPPLRAPAGGFAQVGRAGNQALVDRVLEAVGVNPGVVLELYAGSGNFTRHLTALAARVCACERDPGAVARGRRAAPGAAWSGSIPDLAADVVVLDPPREGADAPNLAAALRARRRIVYVSCDPQTLSRDARRIAAAGFRLTRALALDLMPQTFHVEVVAIFDRTPDGVGDAQD
jgi:23S rRNA (uracil1939-C5)-methyltransferase